MPGPIISVIKNEAVGNLICVKHSREDFNDGSQLIVAEYEEALFCKDGVIEHVFGPGKYSLSSENQPFITRLRSVFMSGGVSPYSCKIYFINKAHHLDLKWGTPTLLRLLDPKWNIQVNVSARGTYSLEIQDSKKFFLKLIGKTLAASQDDIIKNFRTVFLQEITDALAVYLTNSAEEILVTCNTKKALAVTLSESLKPVVNEYGMSLINFYIENIGVPQGDSSLERINELRIKEKEKEFERIQYTLDIQNASDAERYASLQAAKADVDRMRERNQAGPNGWARQEAANILHGVANNPGAGNISSSGLGAGMAIGMMPGVTGTVSNLTQQLFSEFESQQTQQNNSTPPQQPSADRFIVDSEQNATVKCSSCQAINPKNVKFCGECGASMIPAKITCVRCGAELSQSQKFCNECGEKRSE